MRFTSHNFNAPSFRCRSGGRKRTLDDRNSRMAYFRGSVKNPVRIGSATLRDPRRVAIESLGSQVGPRGPQPRAESMNRPERNFFTIKTKPPFSVDNDVARTHRGSAPVKSGKIKTNQQSHLSDPHSCTNHCRPMKIKSRNRLKPSRKLESLG